MFVVHWQAPVWCHETVRSILASTGIEVTVTVVDNSAREAPALLEGLPAGIEVHAMTGNLGFPGGANWALERWLREPAGGGSAVICSHDCRLPPAGLAALAAAFDQDPKLGIVGVDIGSAPRPTAILSAHLRVNYRPWVSGTCMMLRRECARDIGLFAEAIGSYVEDVDYALRAWDRGWRVGAVAGLVPAQAGSRAGSARWEAIARNSILLARRRRGRVGAGVEATFWVRAALLHLFAALAPWRQLLRRRESLMTSRLLWRGVRQGLTGRVPCASSPPPETH